MDKILDVLNALMAFLAGGTYGSKSYQGSIGQYLQIITNNPLLLMFFTISIIGLGIGIISRLTSANR